MVDADLVADPDGIELFDGECEFEFDGLVVVECDGFAADE